MATSTKKAVSVSLGDTRSRAIVLIFGVLVLLALGTSWFFISFTSPQTGPSRISGAPDVGSVMSGKEDPRMTELLAAYDKRQAKEARQSGESMVASLTAYARNAQPIPDPRTEALSVEKPDPLVKIEDINPPEPEPKPKPKPKPEPKPVSEPKPKPEPQPEPEPKVVSRPKPPKLPKLNRQIGRVASSMRSEFKAIATALALGGGTTTGFKRIARKRRARPPMAARGQARMRRFGISPVSARSRQRLRSAHGETLINSGTTVYAVTVMQANSDVPAPVMARVVSGKFRGAKLLGRYERLRDRLRLTFNRIILTDDSKAISINAIAFHPETTSAALATDVNHHFLRRFGSLFIAGAIKGYGEALARGGKRVITTPSGTTSIIFDEDTTRENLLMAAATGASAIGQELEEYANVPVTVRIAAGTPIGVLFLSDVNTKNTITPGSRFGARRTAAAVPPRGRRARGLQTGRARAPMSGLPGSPRGTGRPRGGTTKTFWQTPSYPQGGVYSSPYSLYRSRR